MQAATVREPLPHTSTEAAAVGADGAEAAVERQSKKVKRSLGSFFKKASDGTAALADREAIEVELKSDLQTGCRQVDGDRLMERLTHWTGGGCTKLIFQGWLDWPRNISVSRPQVLLRKGHLALVATLLHATGLC